MTNPKQRLTIHKYIYIYIYIYILMLIDVVRDKVLCQAAPPWRRNALIMTAPHARYCKYLKWQVGALSDVMTSFFYRVINVLCQPTGHTIIDRNISDDSGAPTSDKTPSLRDKLKTTHITWTIETVDTAIHLTDSPLENHCSAHPF